MDRIGPVFALGCAHASTRHSKRPWGPVRHEVTWRIHGAVEQIRDHLPVSVASLGPEEAVRAGLAGRPGPWVRTRPPETAQPSSSTSASVDLSSGTSR
ncbi:hypothetical protein FGK60_44315 [Streptomyces sp. DASNCL29]|nr:hypothetical protein FGK60_44315 [Streptomyces sp. DASNCL29]